MEKSQENDTLRRANRQIERIEELVNDLLLCINIEEMTAKEKIDSAAKLMGQEARMLMIRQAVEAGTPSNTTNIILAAIQRQMRGEIATPSLIESNDE